MLVVVVLGGGIVGLLGSSSSSPGQLAPIQSGATQPISGGNQGAQAVVTTVVGAAGVASPFSGFGFPTFGTGGATTSRVVTNTVTMTATAAMSSTVSPGTIVIQPNTQPSQGASSRTGAPLSTLVTNGSRDIEFFTNVTLEAPSASSAFTKASVIAYSVGGYVAFSTESNTTALIEMRVPAASYQDALTQVEALGTLVNLRSSSNDVTVQYTDLNATLQSLQTEEASLLKILGQSTNINSTLNVESRIQNIDQQINAVQSEILQTRTLVSYATISTFIEEKAPALPLSIKVTATPRSGQSPLSVTFNSVTKGGNQPYIVNYNFGDGTSYEGQSLIHTFQEAGHYNVTVTATDASANVTEAWTIVNVSSPPVTAPSVGGFPSVIAGLFLQVVEGIAEVVVVLGPILAVLILVLFPLRYKLGLSSRKASSEGEGGHATQPPQ